MSQIQWRPAVNVGVTVATNSNVGFAMETIIIMLKLIWRPTMMLELQWGPLVYVRVTIETRSQCWRWRRKVNVGVTVATKSFVRVTITIKSYVGVTVKTTT